VKESLKPGISLTNTVEIDAARTIDFMGEELRVYATPELVRDVESTCRDLILQHSDDNEDSVGTQVTIAHTGATPLGAWVEITATVARVRSPLAALTRVSSPNRPAMGDLWRARRSPAGDANARTRAGTAPPPSPRSSRASPAAAG